MALQTAKQSEHEMHKAAFDQNHDSFRSLNQQMWQIPLISMTLRDMNPEEHGPDASLAQVRGLNVGEAAISPATFPDLHTPADFKRLADEVRERSGGIPIGFKLSANHIEEDIDFALDASADYIILDGRGGGTGAAPLIFRNHISVPTIPALARARRHLDAKAGREVTLVITEGLRVAEDFVKALALGADAVAVSNSAMQAVGCIAARMCNSNNCPVL